MGQGDSMIIPEDPELAWIVGLFEGEGSLNVNLNRGSLFNLAPRSYIKMTDQDVIEQFKSIIPGWRSYLVQDKRLNKDGNKRKLCYEYTTQNESLVHDFVERTFPYYSQKKQADAQRILDLIERKEKHRAK